MSEADYIVSVDGDGISVTDPKGEQKTLALAELNGVMIETNDSGPFGADVWWLLFGADDRIAVAFPQGAAGEQAAIDWLVGLPGFDHEAMIMAMGSTANAVFPVWRRAPDPEIRRYACKTPTESERLRRPLADHAVASARLGRVETLVGQGEEIGETADPAADGGDADAHRTGRCARAAGRHHRLADAFAEQLAERMRKGAQDGELLAADPEHLVFGPDRPQQQLAIIFSTRSPSEWPKRSLIDLKWSASMTSSVSALPVRRLVATACSPSSSKLPRCSSPVRPSRPARSISAS